MADPSPIAFNLPIERRHVGPLTLNPYHDRPMTDLHLILPLSDMTQAVKDAYDPDDIAREMETPDACDIAAHIDAGDIADALTDGNGFHAEIASKLDVAEIARHASFTAALESETLETLKRELAAQRRRIEGLETLVGKVASVLLEGAE